MINKNLYETLYLKVAFENDHEAFKELFYEFYPSLCIFAKRYVDTDEVCEDIVQEVFYNVWKNRKTLNIHSSFRNFLVTSVRNRCTDYIRKQYTHEQYVKNYSLQSQTSLPHDVYTINELQEMLIKALAKLPTNIQTAFNMSRNEKMTYNEIAAEMNVSSKTVESYISRALKVLREELKDYLPLALLFVSLI